MVNQFFGEAYCSPDPSSDSCSEPSIYAFNGFGKLFSNQMFLLWQNHLKGFPAISHRTQALSTFIKCSSPSTKISFGTIAMHMRSKELTNRL